MGPAPFAHALILPPVASLTFPNIALSNISEPGILYLHIQLFKANAARNAAFPDTFPNGRHADHDRGSKFPDVAFTILHGTVRESFGSGITQDGTPEEGGVLDDEFKDVSEGEIGDYGIGGANAVSSDGVNTSN